MYVINAPCAHVRPDGAARTYGKQPRGECGLRPRRTRKIAGDVVRGVVGQVAARRRGAGGRTPPHGRRARHHPARQVRARDVQERRCAQRGAVPPPLHVGHGQHCGKHIRLQQPERAVAGMQLVADGNGTMPMQKLSAIKRPFSTCR